MTTNLNDLGTTPLQDGVDMEHLPEQFGGGAPPPQPGTYRFRLPPTLKPDSFDKVTTQDWGDRVSVHFNSDAPLLIVQTPPAMTDAFLNTPFETRLSNVPRRRGKGDNAPVASDWDYLNRAIGETTRPPSNRAYAEALLAQCRKSPTPEFVADVEFGYFCNDRRDARFEDDKGDLTVVPQLDQATNAPVLGPDGKPLNVQGCGKRVYQNDVPKVNGEFPLRITCPECNAAVRGFPNLTRFKPVS